MPYLGDLLQVAHCTSFGESNMLGCDYEALPARSASSEPKVEVQEDDLFYFNLTSGTTE
ncbi:hypothetical protein D3C84_1050340 [compost metagenome]